MRKRKSRGRYIDFPRPATIPAPVPAPSPLARLRVLPYIRARSSALSFFPLYTTNAEGMIASTTGTALAFGRAMLLCLGLTSPLN